MEAASDSLLPSAVLRKCDGQDITRKGGKGKSRIMLVLPAQFAFLKGAEGTLGRIDKINTSSPEFIVPTSEGDLVFTGRFVEAENLCYLGIDLLPRRMQSVCIDVVTRALVFAPPVLRPGSGDTVTGAGSEQLARGASVRSTATDDMLTQDTSAISQASGEEALAPTSWQWVHGCSAQGRPGVPGAAGGSGGASLKRGASLSSNVGGDADADDDLDEDDNYMDIDDRQSASGSEYGDTPATKSGSSSSAKKRRVSTGTPKSRKLASAQEGGGSGDESIEAAPRPVASRSTARSAAKKPVSYNVDDIPSDEGIDDDDFVAEKPTKKVPVARKKAPEKAPASSEKAAPKSATKPAAKPKAAAKTTPKAAAQPKQASAKVPVDGKEKDAFSFPDSSDSEFCEVVDTPPPTRVSTGRASRAVNKNPKSYTIASGSEDEAEFND
jgi:hypothetical protein